MAADERPTLPAGRIGLVVALLEELKPVAARLGLHAPPGVVVHGSFAGQDLSALISGIGRERAASTAQRLMTEHGCTVLLTVGFAGALDPELAVGQVVLVESAAHEGEPPLAGLLPAAGPYPWRRGACLTAPAPLYTAEEKAAAHQRTGAAVVDTETAAVAAVAHDHGVPWIGVRVVSDAAGETLPWFVAKHLDPAAGEVHLFRMFGDIVWRPAAWLALVRLAWRTRRAGRRLAEAVADVLEALA